MLTALARLARGAPYTWLLLSPHFTFPRPVPGDPALAVALIFICSKYPPNRSPMTARRRERRTPSLPATPVLRLGAHCFLAGDEAGSEQRAPGLGRGVGFQGRGPAMSMDTASVMTEFRWVGGLGRRGPGHAGSSSLASLAAGIWVLLRLPGMGTHASRVDWAPAALTVEGWLSTCRP